MPNPCAASACTQIAPHPVYADDQLVAGDAALQPPVPIHAGLTFYPELPANHQLTLHNVQMREPWQLADESESASKDVLHPKVARQMTLQDVGLVQKNVLMVPFLLFDRGQSLKSTDCLTFEDLKPFIRILGPTPKVKYSPRRLPGKTSDETYSLKCAFLKTLGSLERRLRRDIEYQHDLLLRLAHNELKVKLNQYHYYHRRRGSRELCRSIVDIETRIANIQRRKGAHSLTITMSVILAIANAHLFPPFSNDEEVHLRCQYL